MEKSTTIPGFLGFQKPLASRPWFPWWWGTWTPLLKILSFFKSLYWGSSGSSLWVKVTPWSPSTICPWPLSSLESTCQQYDSSEMNNVHSYAALANHILNKTWAILSFQQSNSLQCTPKVNKCYQILIPELSAYHRVVRSPSTPRGPRAWILLVLIPTCSIPPNRGILSTNTRLGIQGTIFYCN